MRDRLRGAIDFLRSPEAILVVLVLALVAQLPHTAVVFHRLSTTTLATWGAGSMVDWSHAFVAAISIEMAVLLFVVRGKTALSWLFAAASVAMNVVYYLEPETAGNLLDNRAALFGMLLWSAILPMAIALYSHQIGEGNGAGDAYPATVNVTSTVSSAPAATARRTATRREQHTTETVLEETLTGHENGGDAATRVPVTGVVVTATNGAGNAAASTVTALTPTARSMATALSLTTGEKIAKTVELTEQGWADSRIADLLGVTAATVRGYRHKAKKNVQYAE